MKEGQELVEVPEAPIDLFAAFSDPLAELEEKNVKVKFDITTYEGETECKKYIAKVGEFRIGVEKLRVSLKKEFLEGGRAVDKKAKLYQERIAAIDAVHSVPLKALEQKRINEVLEAREAEKAELKAIEDKREADLQARETAANVKEAELKAKEDASNLAEVAQLAAENAVAEEQSRVEEEGIAAAEEIRKRQANIQHRKEFNNEAVTELDNITGSHELSMNIIKSIVKGEIPNVTMNY